MSTPGQPSQPIMTQGQQLADLSPVTGVQLNSNPMSGWQAVQAALRPPPVAPVAPAAPTPQIAPSALVAPAARPPAMGESPTLSRGPITEPATTKTTVANKPRQEAGAKFDQFLKILQGVSNLANTTAAVKSAFTNPKQNSGPILRGGGGGSLSPASGANLQPLGQMQPGSFSAPNYVSGGIDAGSGGKTKDLLALLKTLG